MDYQRIRTLEQIQWEKQKTLHDIGHAAKQLADNTMGVLSPRKALLPHSPTQFLQYISYALTAIKIANDVKDTIKRCASKKRK